MKLEEVYVILGIVCIVLLFLMSTPTYQEFIAQHQPSNIEATPCKKGE